MQQLFFSVLILLYYSTINSKAATQAAPVDYQDSNPLLSSSITSSAPSSAKPSTHYNDASADYHESSQSSTVKPSPRYQDAAADYQESSQLLSSSTPRSAASSAKPSTHYPDAPADYHDSQSSTPGRQFEHQFSTLSDCSNYATVRGGTNFTFVVQGELIPKNSPTNATFELEQKMPNNSTITVSSTCLVGEQNIYICPAPASNLQFASNFVSIPTCGSSNATNACFRFKLNDSEIRQMDFVQVLLYYYKKPVITNITFSTSRRLWLSGEGLSLWMYTCPKSYNTGMKAAYNITRDGQQCVVDWENSSETMLLCWVENEAKGNQVVVRIGSNANAIFVYPPPTVAPSTSNILRNSLLLQSSMFLLGAYLTMAP